MTTLAAMPLRDSLLLALGLWLAWAGLVSFIIAPWLRRYPDGTIKAGILWQVVRVYSWYWHRLKVAGQESIPTPATVRERGLVVIANHTGAVDTFLIQAHCHFIVRWMMAREMMDPALNWVWRENYVIPVERNGSDSKPLREAIRLVKRGEAVGIFPEGRITMPPREIRPFLAGAGLVIAKTKAPVLLAWISGTPETNQMGEALRSRSDARIEYLGVIDYGDERDAQKIADDLRNRIADRSGWPLNDEVLPPGGL